MIAVILALRLSVGAVTYENVPPEVVRISVHDWIDEASPRPAAAEIAFRERRVVIRAGSGRRRVVLLERADGAYLLDGPFWWPEVDGQRVMDRRWRRTIRVAASEPLAGAAVEWVPADPARGGQWPRCVPAKDRLWDCWGAAPEDPGVIVSRAWDRVWWTVVTHGAAAGLRSSRWGRLLHVVDASGDGAGLIVRFAQPAPQSSQRVPGLRLGTTPVAGAQSVQVAPGVAWTHGHDVPSSAWLEMRTAGYGPAYLPLQEIAGGSPLLPITVRLEETRTLDGVVLGSREQRAAGAFVTLFRLIDPPASASAPAREKPRRIVVGETTADAAGAFHLDGVGEADFEVVAWHPLLGRVSSILPRRFAALTLRLESPGTVRGRVLRAGKPLAGVDVISLPGLDAVRTTDDLVDLKGGDTRTGEDGRFAVMLAAIGGGELRVGGGVHPIRRIPLPRAPAPLLDLGDIDLGSPLEITIVLDRESACDLRATGPIGRSGLQIVMAAPTGPGLFRIVLPEPGLWAFGLLCGREPRPLLPPTMQIGRRARGQGGAVLDSMTPKPGRYNRSMIKPVLWSCLTLALAIQSPGPTCWSTVTPPVGRRLDHERSSEGRAHQGRDLLHHPLEGLLPAGSEATGRCRRHARRLHRARARRIGSTRTERSPACRICTGWSRPRIARASWRYWQGQKLLGRPRQPGQWVTMSGIFSVPYGAASIWIRAEAGRTEGRAAERIRRQVQRRAAGPLSDRSRGAGLRGRV